MFGLFCYANLVRVDQAPNHLIFQTSHEFYTYPNLLTFPKNRQIITREANKVFNYLCNVGGKTNKIRSPSP